MTKMKTLLKDFFTIIIFLIFLPIGIFGFLIKSIKIVYFSGSLVALDFWIWLKGIKHE